MTKFADDDGIMEYLQVKFAALSKGNVLVPPTSDDDDIEAVDETDPKWRTLGIDGRDAEVIEHFIDNYPYTGFKYLCRKLKLTPAEALARVERVVRIVGDDAFFCFAQGSGVENLKAEAQKLIDEGWEPGTPPAQPMSKAEVFTILKHVLMVEVNIDGPWTLYDMAHRMGLEAEVMAKYIVDFTVTRLCQRHKYMGGEGRLLSPKEIGEAVANCAWNTEPNGWPVSYKEKEPYVPFVDFCSACATFFIAAEAVCTACGALRMYEPSKNKTLDDILIVDEETEGQA